MSRRRPSLRHRRLWRGGLTAVAAGTLLLTLGAGCGEPSAGITVDDVVDDPDRYVGLTVSVHGEVESLHGGGLFTLEGTDALDEHLLVHTPDEAAVVEGASVRVTGTVRRLVVTDVERELDIDLDTDLEIEFENEPVLLAAQVERITAE